MSVHKQEAFRVIVAGIEPVSVVWVTFTVNDLVAAAPFLSLALMVNVKLPAFVGVPEIFPVDEFRDKPAGNLPLLTVNV